MFKAKLAQAFGSYSCTVSPTNVWDNGYQLDITVTNNGPDSISGRTDAHDRVIYK